MNHLQRRRVSGFTLVEIVAALAVLAVVLGVLAQVSVWSFRERGRNAEHQAALELAANLLETARAQPWEGLPNWAAAQKMPENCQALLPEGRLTLSVEPDKSLPHATRVTVAIHWRSRGGEVHPQTVKLETVFSARATLKTGGEP